MKIVVIAMQCIFYEGDKLGADRPLPITVRLGLIITDGFETTMANETSQRMSVFLMTNIFVMQGSKSIISSHNEISKVRVSEC
jgi:hypothetical protein